jgi:glycosyltransferase involved in cell wall biosynthesis
MVAPTPLFSSYGCHVRIAEEADSLRQLGHEVKVVTYHNGSVWNGLPIERAPAVPWRHHYEVGSSRHKIAFDVLLAAKVAQVALRQRPDIIHAHLHEGALVSFPTHLFTRAPLIFDFQGSLTSEMIDHHFLRTDSLFVKPALFLETVINNLPDAVIASSRRGVRLLRERYGCRNERTTVIPDCVNADRFRPNVINEEERRVLKAQLGIPPERKVVVYLGLLAEYQGTGLLLEAAREILKVRDDVHLLIMGFPGVNVYSLQAHQLGISTHTTFTDRIDYIDAPRYLALGDVAVAPKLSATEGIGKVLNYMAMALPTVAFDTEVSREYLGPWGIYARAGDIADLTRAILVGLNSESRPLGYRLRNQALKHYTWEKAGQLIVDLYDSCLVGCPLPKSQSPKMGKFNADRDCRT